MRTQREDSGAAALSSGAAASSSEATAWPVLPLADPGTAVEDDGLPDYEEEEDGKDEAAYFAWRQELATLPTS